MSDDGGRPFIERILNIAKVYFESANQHIIEGNKFEFDVCDLLMKGAGGAIFFYIALLNIPSSSFKFKFEVLVYFAFSLSLGIFHKLAWSRISLNCAARELKVHARIMRELYEKIFNKENRDEEVLKLWKKIIDEERKYYDCCVQENKQKENGFIYMVTPSHHFPFLVLFQLVFIFFGCAAISDKFSVVTSIKMILGGF